MKKLIILSFLLAGCAQSKGGGDIKYLLPWRNMDGTYSLQEVTISTLSNPYEVRGQAAEVYYKTALTDSGYSGSVANPHLVKAGDVYIPQNSESAIALSVYAQMERLMQFEQRIGIASQLSWPRKVGVELNVTAPVTGTAHNNAHYFTELDVIGLLPYTLNGVSMALNHGVVAHEHFHAHFQHEVLNGFESALRLTLNGMEQVMYGLMGTSELNDIKPTRVTTASEFNAVVLRAWNEGLADLFAAIYLNTSDLYSATIPHRAKERVLDSEPGALGSGAWLRQQSLSAREGIAYTQGTQMARVLYRLAQSKVEPTETFLVRLMKNLKQIPKGLSAKVDVDVMDIEAVFPQLLNDFPVNSAACTQLNRHLSKAMVQRSFTSCSSH